VPPIDVKLTVNYTPHRTFQRSNIRIVYGFFIRHAKDIEFDNVEVSYINEDLRPPIYP
jgi:hypothetical protein